MHISSLTTSTNYLRFHTTENTTATICIRATFSQAMTLDLVPIRHLSQTTQDMIAPISNGPNTTRLHHYAGH